MEDGDGAPPSLEATRRGHITILDPGRPEAPEPTEEEMRNYAAWIGLVPDWTRSYAHWLTNEDRALAREGLRARLPPGRRVCETEARAIYYVNFDADERSWDHPADRHYRALASQLKANCLQGGQSPLLEAMEAFRPCGLGRTHLREGMHLDLQLPLGPGGLPADPLSSADLSSAYHDYALWTTPRRWPRSPVITREVRGRVERNYGRCHSRVEIAEGCSCLTEGRGGREFNAFTCLLCIRTCLNDTADDARELLLQVRFLWAWGGATRLARRLRRARAMGADDRMILYHGPHVPRKRHQ